MPCEKQNIGTRLSDRESLQWRHTSYMTSQITENSTAISADSRFAPSQCNDVSHWLSANLESALVMHKAFPRHDVIKKIIWWRYLVLGQSGVVQRPGVGGVRLPVVQEADNLGSGVLGVLEEFLKTTNNKMDVISQTTFSNVFSSVKMFEFRLEFHWILFLMVQLTISQHWFW